MGLVANLCSEMGVPADVLARMVGLPADAVLRWATAGVPRDHQVDFRVLEDVLALVRDRAPLPMRGALRVGLPALDGASLLEALEREGPLYVQRRISVAGGLDPVWAHDEPGDRPAAA